MKKYLLHTNYLIKKTNGCENLKKHNLQIFGLPNGRRKLNSIKFYGSHKYIIKVAAVMSSIEKLEKASKLFGKRQSNSLCNVIFMAGNREKKLSLAVHVC